MLYNVRAQSRGRRIPGLRARLMAVFSIYAGSSSQPAVPAPESCSQVPEDARSFQLADSTALVGRFVLVMLTTNWPSPRETQAELRRELVGAPNLGVGRIPGAEGRSRPRAAGCRL